MSNPDYSGPAFPVPEIKLDDGRIWQHSDIGMSLRDYFAAKAMQGLLAANAMYGGRTDNHSALARDSFAAADAMLAARSPA